jgi:high affinity Mn2+ porin
MRTTMPGMQPEFLRQARLLATAHACAALGLALFASPFPAMATDTASDQLPDPGLAADPAPGAEHFAVHGQATYVEQETNGFTSPYRGANSLSPSKGAETVDATLNLGLRPWSGAELWVTPEIDQGFGLDNTLGVAGFPSAEAYKVGKAEPYLRLPRAFLRQTLNLDEPTEAVESDQLQLAGLRSANRWVFTVGKYAVTDIFDTNQYAHDAKNDFLNWAAVDTGTFDYAADSWGYTVGASAEWYQGVWTLRGGLFMMSTIPNSEHLDPGFHEFQMISELEHRHELLAQPGRVLVTVFDSRARMGRYADALSFAAEYGGTPDTANVREFRSRLGASMSVEQQVNASLGLFGRLGKAAGNVETYEFTDVDRSVAAGLSLKGSTWHRNEDTIGLVGIVNGISADFERYLQAGGLGPLIGDGQLPHPGAEQIIETYYRVSATSWAQVTLDYQWVKNPAYNTDRGPASIFAVRVHAQF